MSEPAPRIVLLVGHCGFDSFGLKRAVSKAAPGVEVRGVHSRDELDRALDSGDVVLLVNRVLDGNFGTSSGNELIASLTEGDSKPRMLLVSNYPDAQADAEAAGALPGVGKSDLKSEQAQDRLRNAITG